MHCFHLKRISNKNVKFGVFLVNVGIVTFPKSNELRDIFSLAPLDQVLVDDVHISLPLRGKKRTAYVLQLKREQKSLIPHMKTLYITEKNFETLFPKAATY